MLLARLLDRVLFAPTQFTDTGPALARLFGACVISWLTAKASGGWRTSRSWWRRRARCRWLAPRTRACVSASIFSAGRLRACRQGADPAGSAQSDTQRDRGDGRERTARARRFDRARCRQHDRNQCDRYQQRNRAGTQCQSVPAVCDLEAASMGVGLSISRTIIEAHGGSIAPRPNSRGRTVFSFTLPAVAKEEIGDVV